MREEALAHTTSLETRHGDLPQDLAPVVSALTKVAAQLSDTISRGSLGGSLGAEVGDNSDSDRQKALDVLADDVFADALKGTRMRQYASEERETVVEIDTNGPYALAIDPLDGSSNIDVNVSIGTIFGIQPALENGTAAFLRVNQHLLRSGYFI